MQPPRSEDRASNVIPFGVPEEKSIFKSKAVVDEVFEFLGGRQIIIKDLCRLGKVQESSCPHPLLIKLSAIWDRKLLLSRKRNLQDYSIGRLFLREDLPPDHKLRQFSRQSTCDQISSVTANKSADQCATATSDTDRSDTDRSDTALSNLLQPSHINSPSPSPSDSSFTSSSTVMNVNDVMNPV